MNQKLEASKCPQLKADAALLGLGLLPLALGLGGIWHGKQHFSQRRQAAIARHDAALERAMRQATQSNPKRGLNGVCGQHAV